MSVFGTTSDAQIITSAERRLISLRLPGEVHDDMIGSSIFLITHRFVYWQELYNLLMACACVGFDLRCFSLSGQIWRDERGKRLAVNVRSPIPKAWRRHHPCSTEIYKFLERLPSPSPSRGHLFIIISPCLQFILSVSLTLSWASLEFFSYAGLYQPGLGENGYLFPLVPKGCHSLGIF